jgi:hypothetical protein
MRRCESASFIRDIPLVIRVIILFRAENAWFLVSQIALRHNHRSLVDVIIGLISSSFDM